MWYIDTIKHYIAGMINMRNIKNELRTIENNSRGEKKCIIQKYKHWFLTIMHDHFYASGRKEKVFRAYENMVIWDFLKKAHVAIGT